MRNHSRSEYRVIKRGLSSRLLGLFRSRQIYVRSDSDVQFVTLSPLSQILGLSAFLGILFWTAFATVNFAFKDQLLLLREQHTNEARLEYENRVSEMRTAIDRLNDRLLLDQKAYLGRVDAVDAAYRELVQQHEKLVRFFRGGFGSQKSSANEPARPDKSSFNEGTFQEKYTADFDEADQAMQPLAEMRNRFASLEVKQMELLDEALARSNAMFADASGIMRKLGVDARAAPAKSTLQTANLGGPFIPVSVGEGPRDGVAERMNIVARKFEELERIEGEIGALPLYLPMRNVERVSSGFGVRRDPFRRSAAMHAGVDLKAAYGSTVMAVSDGLVTQAGWGGAYGRMVEITHDNGVATRYAHLSSISVSAGTRVKRGGIIGRMGNTGRSTGPHLHYETRVNGRAIDPARFWQAFNDLQTLKSKEK